MGFHKNQRDKLFKKSLLALCVMAVTSPSFAQDDEGVEETEEVVVTGMRQALGSAQDIKRNSATVVESITADDLGSFPDKSVAEALQRVAGITVNRFAASSDTAHFSAEPSGVVVRGLNQVRTEFNGRDSFSANSSRGLSWGDVSPELMSGVDTYKNQMAELIEGGIAGTVNMRTRVPFDSQGEKIDLSVSANYGELSDELTPEISGLYSNRWETGVGEWGFMANFAHSEVTTRSQGNQLYRMNRFTDIYDVDIGGNGSTINPNGADSYVYIPAGVNFRDNIYERERNGTAFAVQWQDPNEVFVATLQYNRSKYDNAWEEYIVGISPADLSFSQSVFYSIQPTSSTNPDTGVVTITVPTSPPQPAPGTPDFTFNEQGLFQTGLMTADIGWWGSDNNASKGYAANASGQQMVNACYGWNGCAPARRGVDMSTGTRSNNNTNVTQDVGFNLKWSPSDNFRANFDFQFVDSTVENYDIEANYSSYANAYVDLTFERPVVSFTAPLNVNQSPGGWSNPNNYYIRSIMDHVEDSEGDEFAAKADFEFDIDSGWIQSVKTGLRFADRDQIVRWSGYNWANVSNTWTSTNAPYWNLDKHSPSGSFNGYPQGHYETRTFKSGYFNLNETEFVFADMDLLQDQKRMASTMSAAALGVGNWNPICSNLGSRSAEVEGTCFTPAEVVDMSEETEAFYVQLNFGGDELTIGDMPITGNLGVRYVRTEVTSDGGISYPEFTPQQLQCTVNNPPPGLPVGQPYVPQSLGCYLSAEDKAFATGTDTVSSTVADHTNVLPSLNIKVDLNDEWLVRVAGSKAISRPDIGNLRNYLNVGGTAPSTTNFNDPLWIKNSSGTITGATIKYSGGAQNPFLKPVEATQFDLALEYYFADVGSFTATVFHKKFDEYIQFGRYNRSVTNNGVTRTVEVNGPLNGDGASLKGFELAFQRYFDFLPAPFDGLGVQTNYTRIYNDGVKNTNLSNVGGEGTTVTGQAPDVVSVNRLEGLSDHSANFVLMYEKGDWESRLAYSWRSEYMVTAIDCCVAYPIWNADYGQLDGSIKYKVNDNVTVSFSGSNLLNEQTQTEQQVSNAEDGGLRLPTGWFQNGTTYTLGVRFSY
jgi:iron complex outermembrane recepter protein